MKKSFFFSVGLPVVAMALCVLSFSEKAFAQADVRGLSDRLDALERTVGSLQAQSYRGGSSSSGSSAGAAVSGDSYSILDRRISALEQQLRDLTGQVEKSSFEVRQLSEKLDRMQADTNIRFEDLQGGGASGAAAAPAAAAQTATASGSLSQPAASGARAGKGTPQEQFDAAFALLRNNDYAGATSALQAFVRDNGDSPLAGNATYWLAQIPFAQGQYDKAAPLFLDVYRKYPKSAKAGESLLKLGVSMSRMGKKQEACASVNRFVSEYPNAGEHLKRTAAEEKAKLGC